VNSASISWVVLGGIARIDLHWGARCLASRLARRLVGQESHVVFHGGRRSGRADPGPLLDDLVRRDRRRAEPGPDVYGRLRPISDHFVPAALAVSKLSREETIAFPDAGDVMREFARWLRDNTVGSPIFVADNTVSTGSSWTVRIGH
jgi:hypothetical protein